MHVLSAFIRVYPRFILFLNNPGEQVCQVMRDLHRCAYRAFIPFTFACTQFTNVRTPHPVGPLA